MAIDIGDYMQSLYRRFGDQPGITIELHKTLLAIQVHNKQANATVFLQGAQISHFQPHGDQPLIWCSPLCEGVPICWPWFGELSRNPGPVQQQLATTDVEAHGFARNRHWQLDAVSTADPDTTELTLSLTLDPAQNPVWPHAARLTLHISIGAQLRLTLETHNTGEDDIALASALHSYLAVSDIDQTRLDGVQGLTYIDCLHDWTTQEQQGALTFEAETDRIYQGTSVPLSLVDTGWQRRLVIGSEGSDSTVVWNPWIDKARTLSQFPEDGYREMVCIETANAGHDFVMLAPGSRHRLTQTLASQPLDA